MKMKKSQLLITTLMAALMLSACGKTSSSPSASSSSSSNSNPPSSSSVTPPGPVIEHQNPLVSALPEDAVTREYKEAFDTMVNDFSSATLLGETNNGVVSNSGILRVLVDSDHSNFPTSTDASIYKMATGTYELQNYDSIGFTMRKVNGTIDYSNLVLALRGDDAWNVYEISLKDALDSDGDALPELSAEFQEVKISPLQTIEDSNTEYTLAGTETLSGTKVLNKILGFHLYAKNECSALVEIKDVFIEKAGVKTVLDDFSRSKVNKTDATVWWRDSTGFIVTPGITLKEGAYYKTPAFEINDNTQVVLNILGDTSGTSLIPVYGTEEKTEIKWSELKDANDKVLVNAVNGAFYPLAIDLAKSNITLEGLTALKVKSTSEVTLSTVFLSSLKEKEAVTEYPHLDTANAVVFDDYSWSKSGFDGNYEASSTDPVITGAGLYYALSYNNGDKVKTDGDLLTFEPNADSYTQFKEGSTRARTTQKYAVFVMKLEGEGDLNNFRINDGTTTVYANQWLAAEGLPSIPSDLASYPYVKDDFVYYIIDLALSGLDIKDLIDMYYTGAAKLHIDSIFFADEYEALTESKNWFPETEISLEGYTYGGSVILSSKSKYVKLEVKGDGVATLVSFRFAIDGTEYWIKNNDVIAKGGKTIENHTISMDGETLILDLVAMGIEGKEGEFHLHLGAAESSTGTMTITSYAVLNKDYAYSVISSNNDVDFATGGYAYSYAGYNPGAKKILITFTSSFGRGTSLKSFRIETEDVDSNKVTVWAKDSLVMTLKDGTAFDFNTKIGAESVEVVVDLQASGLNASSGHLHFHFGSFDDEVGTFNYSVSALYETLPYADVIAAYGNH